MMKRSVFFVMAVLLMVCGLSVFAQEPNPESDFQVRLNAEGNGIIITGYNGTRTDLVIPAEIQGFPVMEIGERAFARSNITTVIFPETVTAIRGSAFSYSRLVSVTIPNSIRILGNSVFSYCAQLERANLELDTNFNWGGQGGSLFQGCTRLTYVSLPEDMTIIQNSMFRECSNLTEITIPSTVKIIGSSAFRDSGLTAVKLPDGVEEIQFQAFSSTKLTSINIPAELKRMDSPAFGNISTLTEVIVPENIGIITRISSDTNTDSVFRGSMSNLDIRSQAALRRIQWQR